MIPVIALLIGAWVGMNAYSRRNNAWGWALGSFILAVAVVPVYLSVRNLKAGEERRGGRGWNIARYFAFSWIAMTLVVAIDSPDSNIAALLTLGGIGAAAARLLGFFLKDATVVETGPTGLLSGDALNTPSPTPSDYQKDHSMAQHETRPDAIPASVSALTPQVEGTDDAPESLVGDAMSAKGIDGLIEIIDQKIRIRPQEFGSSADLQHIMLSQISSILFKRGRLSGYIQFTFTGSQKAPMVRFTKEQKPAFEALKAKIDEIQKPLDQAPPAVASAMGDGERNQSSIPQYSQYSPAIAASAIGDDELVEIIGQKIRITPQEFESPSTSQDMMISQISSALFKTAGTIVLGCIQFMFTGGREPKAVRFTKEQQPAFEVLKAKIDEIQKPLDQAPPAVMSAMGDGERNQASIVQYSRYSSAVAASAVGDSELVEIVDQKIRITRQKFRSPADSQEITIPEIASILFKMAEKMASGYIQFTFAGSQKAKIVTFTKEQQPAFEALKAKINEIENSFDRGSAVKTMGGTAGSVAKDTMSAKGIDGQIEIAGTRIRITREGFVSSFIGNLLGTREIMISQISSIQFRRPGPRFKTLGKTLGSITDTVGYIHFTLRGQEAEKDILQAKAEGIYQAQRDDCAVTFTKEDQPAFEALAAKIDEIRNPLDRASAGVALAIGFGRQVEIVDTRIKITRRKEIFLSGGLPDTKEIMISQISSIQFKTVETGNNGHIQFTLIGDQEAKKDIESDENVVIFTKEQQPAFEVLKAKIDEIRNSLDQVPMATPVSSLDELEKLASLRTRGVISEDEFQAKKKQLLNL